MNGYGELYLYEEIMLLALRDREGKPVMGSMYPYAVAGTVLAELLIANRIKLAEKKRFVQLIDSAPFGDTLLDECLEKIRAAKRRKKAGDWVSKFATIRDLKHKAVLSLCHRGILRQDEKTVLLLFKQKLYPEVDHEPEREIIERLCEAITGTAASPASRTVVLLALAHATDLLKMVIEKKQLKRYKQRIEQLTSEIEIGRITKEVIDAVNVAVTVAATSAATV